MVGIVIRYLSLGAGLLFLILAGIMGLDLISPFYRDNFVILLALAAFFFGCWWRIGRVKAGLSLKPIEKLIILLLLVGLLVILGPYILLWLGSLFGLVHAPVVPL